VRDRFALEATSVDVKCGRVFGREVRLVFFAAGFVSDVDGVSCSLSDCCATSFCLVPDSRSHTVCGPSAGAAAASGPGAPVGGAMGDGAAAAMLFEGTGASGCGDWLSTGIVVVLAAAIEAVPFAAGETSAVGLAVELATAWSFGDAEGVAGTGAGTCADDEESCLPAAKLVPAVDDAPGVMLEAG
jgi:hypothetical protein